MEIPIDSCQFFCTPGNPCATPIVTRGEGSFSYQGVSTRGVRHAPGHSKSVPYVGKAEPWGLHGRCCQSPPVAKAVETSCRNVSLTRQTMAGGSCHNIVHASMIWGQSLISGSWPRMDLYHAIPAHDCKTSFGILSLPVVGILLPAAIQGPSKAGAGEWVFLLCFKHFS